MPPGPDEVHEHHGIAAGFVGEEVKAEVAIQEQHGQGRRKDGESGDDQETGGERRPAEDRHAHIGHAGSTNLQNRGDEIDAGQQCADAGNLQRPQVIVHPDPRRIVELGKRRIRQPAGAGELTDHQREIDEQRTGRRQPEADRIERREGDVADAELQGDDDVDQPDHEGHRHEQDHQRAVRREDLIVVLGRQVSRRAEGERLLRSHHDGVGETAQQHDHGEEDVHHADALVVDAGDPLAPEIRRPTLQHDIDRDAAHDPECDAAGRPAGSAGRAERRPS